MSSFLPYCSDSLVNQYNIYLSLLIGGLISGFAHCTAMCGPFVVMQTSSNMAQNFDKNPTEFTRLKNSALLPYHLGRITTYTILGMVATYLSSHILTFSGMKWLSSSLLAIAGLIFISSAIFKNKKFFVASLQLPKQITNKIKPLFTNPRGFRGYLLGLVLGFIPCGMIFAAIFAVSSTASLQVAFFAMILFGLGTIPGLFALSFGSNWAFGKFKMNYGKIKNIAIMVSGFFLIFTAIDGLIN